MKKKRKKNKRIVKKKKRREKKKNCTCLPWVDQFQTAQSMQSNLSRRRLQGKFPLEDLPAAVKHVQGAYIDH
jgi:hypothetical protein